jgi:hypothetical protein
MADLDFAQPETRHEWTVVACKRLREFNGENRFTDEAIARFMEITHGATN